MPGRFCERLKSSESAIKSVTGGVKGVTRLVDIAIEVDGRAEIFQLKRRITLIIGIGFCKIFDNDTQLGQDLWRARKGEWRAFASMGADSKVYAECTGISEISDEQSEIIDRLREEGTEET